MRLTGLWWWIDRWRKSSAYMDMTLEEQGAYRNLLDEASLRGGPLPNDQRILAKACGDALAWPRVGRIVMKRFTLTRDGWRNSTLDGVLTESARRSKKQADYRNRHGNESGNRIGNDPHNDLQPPDPDPDLITGSGSHHRSSDLKEQAIPKVLAATTVRSNGSSHRTVQVDSRSRRPIFQGQRFVVFDWMLEDLGRTLGQERLEAFHIDEWFDRLDAEMVKANHVIPKQEQWPYIQAALLAEAQKRGLPIVSIPVPQRQKLTTSQKLDAAGADFIAAEHAKTKAIR